MSIADRPVRLSVAMIVRDAAEAVRETLQSIRTIADEMVVVDTGSTDETRAVAERLGARVFDHDWSDDFSAARNACMSHVEGQWILWLDAGEQFADGGAAQLADFLAREADPAKAYMLLVQIPPSGPQAAGEQVGRIRLLPNRPGLRFIGRVRETVADSLAAAGLEVEGLPYAIHRGLDEHDPQKKTAKARRNIHLADLAIKEQGPQAQLLNCIGDAFQTLEDHSRAAQCFRHAIGQSERGSVDMLEAYYGLLTSLDPDPKSREQQLQVAVQANEVFPLDAQLLCAMGGYLQALGRTDLAEKSYRTAFDYGQVNPRVWHVPEVRDIAAICCSIALQVQNRLDEAQQVVEQALAANPEAIRARRHLIELHVKRGRRDEALAQVDALPKSMPGREALRSAVQGASLAVQQNWVAAKAYLQTAYAAGCQEAICFRWLTISLVASGEVEEAKAILRRWQQFEPQNGEAAKYLQSLEQQTQQLAQQQLASDQASHQSAPPAEPTRDDDRQWRFDSPTASPHPGSNSPSHSTKRQHK